MFEVIKTAEVKSQSSSSRGYAFGEQSGERTKTLFKTSNGVLIILLYYSISLYNGYFEAWISTDDGVTWSTIANKLVDPCLGIVTTVKADIDADDNVYITWIGTGNWKLYLLTLRANVGKTEWAWGPIITKTYSSGIALRSVALAVYKYGSENVAVVGIKYTQTIPGTVKYVISLEKFSLDGDGNLITNTTQIYYSVDGTGFPTPNSYYCGFFLSVESNGDEVTVSTPNLHIVYGSYYCKLLYSEGAWTPGDVLDMSTEWGEAKGLTTSSKWEDIWSDGSNFVGLYANYYATNSTAYYLHKINNGVITTFSIDVPITAFLRVLMPRISGANGIIQDSTNTDLITFNPSSGPLKVYDIQSTPFTTKAHKVLDSDRVRLYTSPYTYSIGQKVMYYELALTAIGSASCRSLFNEQTTYRGQYTSG
jgi:hypothetical protein